MLGKETTQLTVSDIMSRSPIMVDGATTIRELAEILDGNEISGVPVVDAQERLIGVVSKTDILHRYVEGPIGLRPGTFFNQLAEGLASGSEFDPEDLGVVEDFMSIEPVTARADETLVEVACRMADESVHRVIVTNEEKQVLGVVTTLDLLRRFSMPD